MDLELWAVLSAAISVVAQRWKINRRQTHPTERIARVQLWAALHDRPTRWACSARNWTGRTCPPSLPDQSCMSRRLRTAELDRFFQQLSRRLRGRHRPRLLRIIDGKPLELPGHSRDPHARRGRGVGRIGLGYKLHAIISGQPMPDAFVVTPLNRCEKQMARRLIGRLGGGGYLLGDANYNASWLFDYCRSHNHQLICPRARPQTELGHHYQAADRRRAVALLEPSEPAGEFGRQLYALRSGIERSFADLVNFGGGLCGLPSWVRGIGRVRRWVLAKLLINAARIRINRKRDG